ncbi:hypothetical protein PVAP13_2KG150332 [Panicum virgatum]|uniref:Secreted protein n=1 Tax=Panicum virgatum TaxID=38727 RepID=A0A8T0W5F6_PANVG|nr:hypothetical protein PVAP13_2KG150332 [Panicum virgatum]
MCWRCLISPLLHLASPVHCTFVFDIKILGRCDAQILTSLKDEDFALCTNVKCHFVLNVKWLVCQKLYVLILSSC